MRSPTEKLKALLLEEENGQSYFSAANTDSYHVSTGQAMESLTGWNHTANIVLRGKGTEPYSVVGGLRPVLEALADFRFDKRFIKAMKGYKRPDGLPKYNPDYLDRLAGQPFSTKLDMMPDGSVTFPGPLGRIHGPHPIQVKWIDTILSCYLRAGMNIATKVSRLKYVGEKYKIAIADNSMRRSADLAGLLTADICAMLGLPTSNMAAAMGLGQQAVGTMDHWYMMAKMVEYYSLHPDKPPASTIAQRMAHDFAFEEFMKQHPEHGMLLIDTISNEVGLESAIRVLKTYKPKTYGVRIDSGDLAKESKWARKRLDAEGLSHITVSVTGGLRAVTLESIIRQGGVCDLTGIGEYFQPRGEMPRDALKDPMEPMVNNEIVTKLGFARAPDDTAFRLIKLSSSAGKASRGGILDVVKIQDAKNPDQVAYVEVDLTSSPVESWADNRLGEALTSRRLHGDKTLTFAKGSVFTRPIVPVLDGPRLLNPDIHTHANCRARYAADFYALDDSLKQVDMSHSAAPAGIELGHYQRNMTMALAGQIIERC